MEPIRSIAERLAQDFQRPENPVTENSHSRWDYPGDESCPICHGVGFVTSKDAVPGDPDFGKMRPCACRMKSIQEAQNQTRALRANLSGYEHMRFESFSVEGRGQLLEEQKATLQYALNTAKTFAENPSGWLFFSGPYGTGKTHLAAAIANAALEKGLDNIFQPVPDLLDLLRVTFGNGSTVRYEERFERIRSIPLLILDDLGAQSQTPWAQEKLYQIINYRYANKLPTVITSNTNLRDMDGRIASRLKDPLTIRIAMEVPDYRDELGGSGTENDISILHLLSNRTFASFDHRKSERLSDTALSQLASAYRESLSFARDPHGWLVLAGPGGIGKTHLAAAIGNYRREQMDTPIFVTASDLLDHLRATFSPNSSVTYDAVFEQTRSASLLILNYLDTMNSSPWAKEKMYQILNYRYQAQLPTVITLIKPIQEVDINISSRLVDASLCTVVQMFDVPMYNRNPDISFNNLKDGRTRKPGPSIGKKIL